MAPFRWIWDAAKRRVRDSSVGRFVARRQLAKLRDGMATTTADRMRDLAGRAVRGEITPAAFRAEFRALVRNANGASYLLGRGGVNAMTPADFRILGDFLAQQHAYADGFAAAIEAGRLTEAQAAARAELYAGAGVRAYELGQAAAWGVERMLPEYPGESCRGKNNCRCSWSIRETDRAIECTWRLGGQHPCDPCKANAARWNPLVLPKPFAPPAPEPVRLAAVRRGG